MGRYYSGDIEGKFWFAIQSSNDASFFGGRESEPNHIDYYFSKDDLKDVNNGIKKCEKKLGQYRIKLDKFFKKNDRYNDESLAKEMEISERKLKEALGWYARLELGKKIKKCVEKQGECSFEAEL